MARDRQRAKQRRRRTSDTGSQAREIGLGDSTADEAGIGDVDEGAPDPLAHASGEVEIARAAEAGIPVDPPNDDDFDDDDFERAPDDVEGDLVPSAGGGRGRGRSPAHPVGVEESHPPRKERGRVLTFLRHSADELRRVQWPDRRHVFQATAVVLGFVLIAGGWLGLMDAIWQPVVNAIL